MPRTGAPISGRRPRVRSTLHKGAWRRVASMNMPRVALVWIALLTALIATSSAGPAGADPPSTEVITVMAVGPGGEAINGYKVASGPGNVGQAGNCSEASPSAVADNVYYCSPS